jgi:GGDEF domain-containing protein
VRRNLLQPGTLVDSTRHCRQCASAHQHFLDVCPHCSSIDIRKGASLHCFACGQVAPEGDFHGDLGLVCPKCHAHLRHIGVDYDRPLTQFACARCHHAFIEAAVVVRCLDCGAEDDPATLDVREVSVLRLSPHGRAALRAGQLQESFAVLETTNFVVPNFFRRMLDWALATQVRHQELRFGVVVIEFLNATALIDTVGATRTFMMLDELARRLRELLRTSDLTTRTSEQVLWAFLPFSSAEGFAARVRHALAEAQSGDGARLEARLAWLQAPEQVRPGMDAETLMEQLQRWTDG